MRAILPNTIDATSKMVAKKIVVTSTELAENALNGAYIFYQILLEPIRNSTSHIANNIDKTLLQAVKTYQKQYGILAH